MDQNDQSLDFQVAELSISGETCHIGDRKTFVVSVEPKQSDFDFGENRSDTEFQTKRLTLMSLVKEQDNESSGHSEADLEVQNVLTRDAKNENLIDLQPEPEISVPSQIAMRVEDELEQNTPSPLLKSPKP